MYDPAVMDRHGYVGGDTGRLDANGGAMAALGGHALLSSDAGFAEAAVEVAASAALWVRRRIRRARAAAAGCPERAIPRPS